MQLHGKETPSYCELIKEFGVEVIKSFSIKDYFDFSLLVPYQENCDFFLFDTKGASPGGNGYTFSWSILKDYYSQKPFFFEWWNRTRKHTTD